MGKYLITGRQGSGKTTVIKALQKRGYTAYNTDDLQDVTRLQNIQTGEIVVWPKEGVVDWSTYAWNWQKPEIMKLLSSDKLVFIGAITNNQREFYSLFDKVFVLTVDTRELVKRLGTHEHGSHHEPGEIERLTKDHLQKQANFIKEGAEPINANRPVAEIVDDILLRIS